MKKSNLWQNLLTVLVVLVAIVLAGAATNLSHIGEAKYLPDDTPENVAYNYQLAVIKRDFATAYKYVSPTLPGYPASVEALTTDIQSAEERDIAIPRCVYIESVTVKGTNAEVTLFEQWKTSGICQAEKPATPPNNEFNPIFAVLESQNGQWKIVTSNGHFPLCWSIKTGCK